MALVRFDEKTLVQKIKTFIIGNEKPNWFTRLSVLIGFAIWFYYAIWHTLIFLSIAFIDQLKNPDLIRETYGKIGGKYSFNIRYQDMNWLTIDVIYIHAIVVLLLLLISLAGLVLIYRRKKWGYIIYFIGNLSIILFSFFFLGAAYFEEQISYFDKIMFLVVTIYFLIGMFFLKNTKATENPLKPQTQQ
ncbi:hypothetical protein DNU06_04195 [Putridiphycobacter roseus]|uniref:Uncharacterized protein n=1 Tax=Putridiphycobacter roseus TaxID=2219161 RepID=A0A2W1NEG6_9FLAO|nr:hypothetical protein [Putridiphycobacter roseus]PZE17825.1 hypothetical protein DNU06_04195 [Putridiphycobacter roseus]